MKRKSYHQTIDENLFEIVAIIAKQNDSTVSCVVESLVSAAIKNDKAIDNDFRENIEKSRCAYNTRNKK